MRFAIENSFTIAMIFNMTSTLVYICCSKIVKLQISCNRFGQVFHVIPKILGFGEIPEKNGVPMDFLDFFRGFFEIH